jgi:hypothetical protein
MAADSPLIPVLFRIENTCCFPKGSALLFLLVTKREDSMKRFFDAKAEDFS